jgi:hypothetical protein
MSRVYSFSRRSTLERCLFQYFLEYYVTPEQSGLAPERRRLVLALKNMTSGALLAGEVVHRFIKLSIQKPHLTPRWLSDTAMGSFDRAVRFAQDPKTHKSQLNEPYPPQELVEYSYAGLDGDALLSKEREKLNTALHHFFHGKHVRGYLNGLAGYQLFPEKRLKGMKEDGWSISGQIDLLAHNGSSCEVVDWKLGTEERGSDSLQLYIYGVFGADTAGVPREQVHVRRAFLGDDTIERPRIMDSEATYVGRARLLQDIELMQELHEYGEAGREGIFTPCNQPNVCRRCKFRAICHGAPLAPNSLLT